MCFSTSAAKHLSIFTIFLAYLSVFFHTWPPWELLILCVPMSWPVAPACSAAAAHSAGHIPGCACGHLEAGRGTWQEARLEIQGIWQRHGRSREQGLRKGKVWAAKLWRVGDAGVQECVTLSRSCSGRDCAHWGQLEAQALEVVHGCCCPRGAHGCPWVAAQSHSRCSRCSWA